MAAKVAFLDRVLTAYGPNAAGARVNLRDAVADAVHRMWPENAGAKAELTPNTSAGEGVYAAIAGLIPRDDMQGSLKVQAETSAADLGQLRLLLLAQTVPSIPSRCSSW